MEYDNDRPRIRTSSAEIFYWILLTLPVPVINSITLFPHSPWMWPVLLFISGILLPAYIVYSRLMGTMFLTAQRKTFPILLSILSFLVIGVFLLTIDYGLNKFDLRPDEKRYFTLTTTTVIRESWWIIVNMSLSVAIYFVRKNHEDKIAMSLLRKENNYLHLRYLRSQLNPHFLFNTLNSIYSLSMQKSDRTPEVVVRLADIMRYLIYECDQEKIPLDKEIEFIRNYIEIEKLRHRADIRLTVEGDSSGILIEPFLFISFIENGFKHAMDHTFKEPFIYITFRIGNGQIILNVINSTNADLEMQAKNINGKGLSHSRSLLELLYPSSYDLDIIQTEKDENRTSKLRLHNARERLQTLYPDTHTLDVILNKSTFTVSLIVKTSAA